MLVLSRKKNESIVIDDDIKVVVVEIRVDKVRLGVEAPKDMPVHRTEVFESIRRNEGESRARAFATLRRLNRHFARKQQEIQERNLADRDPAAFKEIISIIVDSEESLGPNWTI